ncbi:ABC transporter permease subunit [Myxococcota bacterium]|nr:ABC transporter permease subunit [Myxococcota bacterium]
MVRLHDPAGLAPQLVLEGHRGAVHALALSPNGLLLSGGYDRALRAWDPGTGALAVELPPLPQAINDLALSPAGDRLALAGDDRKVRILSLDDAPLATLDPGAARVLAGHHLAVTSVAWSDDGRYLVSGSEDESARLWDVASGSQRAATPDIGGELRQVAVAGDRVYTAARSWRTVPVWRRYVSWLWRTARLDFDRSFVDDRPVIDKIAEALPVTVGLNLVAIGIIYAVSVPVGVLAAVRRGGPFDQVSGLVLFLLYSVPNFWLATLLIMALSSEKTLDLLPSVGLYSAGHEDLSYLSWLWDRISHLVLPVTVMVYGGFASLSRYVRSSMLDTIQEDYVRTARAKGLPEYLVVTKHAFRNSLITVVTLVASLLPAMIGGSVIVEYIFSIEGMGRLGFNAILARDYPVIMAITTFSAVLTLLGILLSDLLYSVVDPRVRTE